MSDLSPSLPKKERVKSEPSGTSFKLKVTSILFSLSIPNPLKVLSVGVPAIQYYLYFSLKIYIPFRPKQSLTVRLGRTLGTVWCPAPRKLLMMILI